MRRGRLLGAVAGAVVAVLAVGTFVVVRGGGPDGPAKAVAAYLGLWERGAWLDMRTLVDNPPADYQQVHEAMTRDLRVERRSFTARKPQERGNTATAAFTARLDIGGLGPWTYESTLDLVRREGEWKVRWSTTTLHPSFTEGRRFTRTRTWAKRAPLLAADGTPLTADGTVVAVGIEPRRVKDRAVVKAALQQHAGVDPARVDTLLDKPGLRPDIFVPVIDLREERYATVRSHLQPVPGLVFQRKPARVTPAEGFARHTVGRMGEVTADRLKELGSPYIVGDEVGLTGLEAAFERQLAGTPSGEIRLEADGPGTGTPSATLTRFEGSPGSPVRTTIDSRVQSAADAALEGMAQPSALVAVDIATGEVRAVTSRPLDQPFNRALAGRYPPGSTFKIVTAAALLQNGLTPGSTLSCPPEATVGGKKFRNFEGESAGALPLHSAFAHSCNTAFVQAVKELSSDKLSTTAEAFGFGTEVKLPLTAVGGAFPAPKDDAERAAAAIGQARVTASPLHMAALVATAAGGTWRPPSLVRGDGDEPVGAGETLDAAVAEALRAMLREVVTEGTGTAAAVPGRAVAGKTGTAEFGTDVPPQTHAWFVGFEGNLAFAVLVEGGGVGGRVAAPIAARFVSAPAR